jgi:hypothetical protein
VPDVPLSIVFLVFYIVGAAGNMTLFLVNLLLGILARRAVY